MVKHSYILRYYFEDQFNYDTFLESFKSFGRSSDSRFPIFSLSLRGFKNCMSYD